MLGYLEKFNKLPAAIKSRVSAARALDIIEALEEKYKVALAVLIMKTTVGELALSELADNLLKENLSAREAGELAKELKEKIFAAVPLVPFSATASKPAAPAAALSSGEVKTQGASFFFSPDDEEEIRRLTKKITVAENSALMPAAVDDKLEEIISRARINFGSADLAARFSQILRTYLRGIRNKLDVKATLMKPFLSGGLSFDEDSADKVILLADKILNSGRLEPPQPVKADSSPSREISRDVAYDFSRLTKAKNDKIKDDLKKLDTSHELAPLTPAVPPARPGLEAAAKNAPKAKEKTPLPPKKTSQTETGPSNLPLIKRRFEAENLSQNQKVKVEDVKYVPRVMGPLDELKYLDLIGFRRLEKDPFKSADKIKSKINLLAEENYGKKLEGIKLWRLSPVNKLYLEIGRFSISENKPVDVIIEERKMAGADHLTEEEFKAIMDLNKDLRF